MSRSRLRAKMLRRTALWFVAATASTAVAALSPGAQSALEPGQPPTITYKIDGIRGDNGWYRGSRGGDYVVLHWTVRGPNVTIVTTIGCTPERIRGPSHGSTRTCTAISENGISALTTHPIKIDADPPVGANGHPARAADSNGWYNHPVAIAWGAEDETSGIAACTSLTYRGPDRSHARLVGRCVDAAGNRSSSSQFFLRYDQTPPRLRDVAAAPSAHAVRLRWKSAGAVQFRITRSPGRKGPATSAIYVGKRPRFRDRTVTTGVRYRYLITATDQAGNSVHASVVVIPREPLYAPRFDARLHRPAAVRLGWVEVPAASFYNLQVWRAGTKVLSAWPVLPHFRLSRQWSYGGVTRQLSPGRYTWYVWPAYGRLSKPAFGRLLGSSTFVVIR